MDRVFKILRAAKAIEDKTTEIDNLVSDIEHLIDEPGEKATQEGGDKLGSRFDNSRECLIMTRVSDLKFVASFPPK